MKLLLVQASPNLDSSHSRKWSLHLAHALMRAHPTLKLIQRDLVLDDTPHLKPTRIMAAAALTAPRSAQLEAELKISDDLVTEFLGADILIFGVPMYNFGIPSVLKAYIDQIVRVGRTFSYTATGPQGLVDSSKKIYFVMTSGGKYSDGPAKTLDFVAPYLSGIFGFLGIKHIEFVRLELLALGPDAVAAAETKAATDIQALVSSSKIGEYVIRS